MLLALLSALFLLLGACNNGDDDMAEASAPADFDVPAAAAEDSGERLARPEPEAAMEEARHEDAD